MIPDIRLSDYHYELPPERIAQYPLPVRDQARLLAFRQGEIRHQTFRDLPGLLEPGDLLVFNDTKVIPARLHFQRQTGAWIEVLLLHPRSPAEVALAMLAQGECRWQCIVGNRKRWKGGEALRRKGEGFELEARLEAGGAEVAFRWEPAGLAFTEVLAGLGELPLPPYLQRQEEALDRERYQTVFARHAGAVAAPTAGLHMSPQVLEALTERGIGRLDLTLHVSAGTFLPVRGDRIRDHEMHAEQIRVSRQVIEALAEGGRRVIPIGTTALRTLESLYWLGVMAMEAEASPPAQGEGSGDSPPSQEGRGSSAAGASSLREGSSMPDVRDSPPFKGEAGGVEARLPQAYAWQMLERGFLPLPREALQALLRSFDGEHFVAETHLLILPGCPIQLCQGLITNFHLPETTLILLVAALVGEDWRRIYQAALDQGYRFLSYGDSSLLLP
jgi:S-adenosylmethionine:tRNA ribosyltransferase-isomerase